DCPSIGRVGQAVESARIELASSGCKPDVLPLNYNPAGREGIEPSLRVLEARLVTMTVRPKERGDVRGSNPPPSVHSRPSSQTSNVTMSGLSWARTTFFRSSAGRYHSTSSQPVGAWVFPGQGAEHGGRRPKPREPARGIPTYFEGGRPTDSGCRAS